MIIWDLLLVLTELGYGYLLFPYILRMFVYKWAWVCFILWNLVLQWYFFLPSAAAAGSNKSASSSTSLNTRKLDEETENLSREYFSITFA